MNDPLPSPQRAGRRRPRPEHPRPARIPQHQEQRQGIDDPDQAAQAERPPPAKIGMVRRIAAEPADDDPDVDPHLMETDRTRSRGPGVEVGDQRERGGNVERLADPHEGPRHEQLLVGGDVSGRPGHQRPHEQAPGDDVPAAVPVRQISPIGLRNA